MKNGLGRARSKSHFLRSLSYLVLAAMTAWFSGFFGCSRQEMTVDTLSSTREELVSPAAEYRPVPLWVWNDRMSIEVIKEQLTDFKDKGFGGVFVHPRPGLITPYLSEEWLYTF